MAQKNDELSDDNVHVKELKRLFHSCNVGRNGLLEKDGLQLLCEKLNLSDFSESIVDRVLCEDNAINFKQFKDRFLLFLPEIIDLASGNTDELLIAAYKTCSVLGIKDTQRLSKYDVHAICESTSELDLLSVLDINLLFEKSSIGGKVSLVDFIAQYRAKEKMSDEIHFIADSYRISSLHLFENLDSLGSGEADHSTVIEYLTNSGLKVEEAVSILKDIGQSSSSMVGLVALGNYLESSLSHTLNSSQVPARAAVFCMKSLIENYRCSIREFELRCEHLQKQIHIANQRRTMLIEELDQNQQSIEASYNNRLKEMEERCRSRIAVMEEKFRQERVEMQREFETIEKDLSLVRHNETSLKNKLLLVERHNKRISSELEEQTENVNTLEKENRQLRTEARKKQQFRSSEDNAKLMVWKQKVELLVAHNKRLREKMQELSKKSKNSAGTDQESFVQWTPPFKSQLLLIRKRRSQKGDTLSEMESEPESIFYRRRRKRLYKKKDRMKRYEQIHNITGNENDAEENATSTHDETGRKIILSPRNRDMLNNLKDSDSTIAHDLKLIARAKGAGERGKKSDETPNEKNYAIEIKMLQNSLATQKQMYEMQILNLSRKVASLQNEQHKPPEAPKARFYTLFENYRKTNDKTPSVALGVEKNTGVRSRVAASLSAHCSKCSQIEPKIGELASIVGAHKEFTVEDPVPSMSSQDKAHLQCELGRLKTRLNLARSKVIEIQNFFNNSGRTNLKPDSKLPYSSRTHRSFADLRDRTPLSERSESSRDSVADPSQFNNMPRMFQKQFV
ncbi:unnamed protein product [Caenorhabditis bovis]|uniref:EF-hand domain-containing protein n=1 Tax=Caenorhabditis bovis TaxID=2654633 RepID=A0A8S1FAU6_9PELO|nr:unnamed protein product [Caenorhabditis bovis]